MGFSGTTILNCAAIVGVAGMVTLGASQANFQGNRDGVDMMATASIAAAPFATPNADDFTLINHATNQTCIIHLHRAEGYDVHRIEPEAGCATALTEISAARAWKEGAKETVTISDRKGNSLMKLARGDGFAWEVIEPKNLKVSLSAL